MTPNAAYPDWLPLHPPVTGMLTLQEAGEHWDAVRAPIPAARTALSVLHGLGVDDSAVLHDPQVEALYWLVPVGTADRWTVPGTRALGKGHHLGLPDAGRTCRPGSHWLQVPHCGAYLTDPDLLWAALGVAAAEGDLKADAS